MRNKFWTNLTKVLRLRPAHKWQFRTAEHEEFLVFTSFFHFFKSQKNKFWTNFIKIPRVAWFRHVHNGQVENADSFYFTKIAWNSACFAISTWPYWAAECAPNEWHHIVEFRRFDLAHIFHAPPVHSDPHLLTSDKIDDLSFCPQLPKKH